MEYEMNNALGIIGWLERLGKLKTFNYLVRIRTRDLPASIIKSQTTAPSLVPHNIYIYVLFETCHCMCIYIDMFRKAWF
jgi:hypothetical protein